MSEREKACNAWSDTWLYTGEPHPSSWDGFRAGYDARDAEVELLRKELALYQVPEEEPGLGPSDTSRGALVRQWQRAQAAEAEVERLRKELASMHVAWNSADKRWRSASHRAEAAEAHMFELEDMLRDADTALHAENAALRAKLAEQADALDEDIQRARESRGPVRGMTVPNLGRFCSATPSVLRDLTQLARDLRALIG